MYFFLNSYENRTWHQTKINTYKELEWIDHQTSQIQVEMLIYNPNYQLMSSLAATIQMKKGGRFECSYRIESMPAWPYGANRVALIVMDALMLVVLLPLIMVQVHSILHLLIPKPKWGKAWREPTVSRYLVHVITHLYNYASVQWVEILIVVFTVLTNISWYGFVAGVRDNSFINSGDDWWGSADEPPQSYTWLAYYTEQLFEVSRVYTNYKMDMSLLIIFLSVRILDLVKFQPTLSFFTRTIKECYDEICNFLILFLLLFIGFAISGWHLFGHQLDTYSTIWEAFMTNLNFVMGDFDWPGMLQAAPAGAYFYYLLFTFVIYIVLFNIMMAIMLDAYEVTKHEQEMLGSGHSLGDDLYHMARIVCHLDIYNKFPSTEVINSKIDLLPEENQEEENLSAVDMMKIFGMKYHTANLFVMLVARATRFKEEKYFFFEEDEEDQEDEDTATIGSDGLDLVDNYEGKPTSAFCASAEEQGKGGGGGGDGDEGSSINGSERDKGTLTIMWNAVTGDDEMLTNGDGGANGGGGGGGGEGAPTKNKAGLSDKTEVALLRHEMAEMRAETAELKKLLLQVITNQVEGGNVGRKVY